MVTDPQVYFQNDYVSARALFRKKLESAGSKVFTSQYQVPSERDPDLFVDFAYLPAREKNEHLFISLSGIHGLEGFAGSAIQSLWLDQLASSAKFKNFGFFFAHAMNPYGFKYFRRNTEKAVNLNRNCLVNPKDFQELNPKSIEFFRKMVPREKVSSLTSDLVQSHHTRNGRSYFASISKDEFTREVGRGQLQDPDGLEYGGQKLEPQIQVLIEMLSPLFAMYENIILLDIHTGLGDRGRMHLLRGDSALSMDETLASKFFKPEEDSEIYHQTPSDTDGFYQVRGDTNDLFPQLQQTKNNKICAWTLEFGTMGHSHDQQMQSLNLWMLEHQGNHFGFETKELEQQIRKMYLEKFCPDSDEWKRSVLEASSRLMDRFLQRA